MSKQTALQILVESMTTSDVSFYQKEIAIALQMEREQIVEACNSQKNDYRGMPTYNKSGEQYYNETYGGHSVDANEMIDHNGDVNEMVGGQDE